MDKTFRAKSPGPARRPTSDVPSVVLENVADQLHLDPEVLPQDLGQVNTRFEHQRLILTHLDYRPFDDAQAFRLIRWLYARVATSTVRPSVLFDLTTAHLVSRRVVLRGSPGQVLFVLIEGWPRLHVEPEARPPPRRVVVRPPREQQAPLRPRQAHRTRGGLHRWDEQYVGGRCSRWQPTRAELRQRLLLRVLRRHPVPRPPPRHQRHRRRAEYHPLPEPHGYMSRDSTNEYGAAWTSPKEGPARSGLGGLPARFVVLRPECSCTEGEAGMNRTFTGPP
ncbi:DUF4158 domain-containing protein [Deinococcus aetherius]|uniref:DUF4158 domain-containing protein n=1 Tax=Deinococcus aetherius TaxID=200252 RepID=UPI0022311133|nr:DUF4158 domain-containing protein [Deinococcus aetherius]